MAWDLGQRAWGLRCIVEAARVALATVSIALSYPVVRRLDAPYLLNLPVASRVTGLVH